MIRHRIIDTLSRLVFRVCVGHEYILGTWCGYWYVRLVLKNGHFIFCTQRLVWRQNAIITIAKIAECRLRLIQYTRRWVGHWPNIFVLLNQRALERTGWWSRPRSRQCPWFGRKKTASVVFLWMSAIGTHVFRETLRITCCIVLTSEKGRNLFRGEGLPWRRKIFP